MVACEGCVARVADADSSNVGWRGTPGIVDRPEPLDATIVETSLAVPVIDLAPIAAQPDPVTTGLRIRSPLPVRGRWLLGGRSADPAVG